MVTKNIVKEAIGKGNAWSMLEMSLPEKYKWT
jgi:hypothetical protein